MPDNETFVATLPSNTICELDEDRLLATGPGPAGHISEDAGRTWGESFPYMQDGAPIDAQPMTGGVLRLNTGELGMVYRKEVDAGAAGYDTIAWYFARSGDEGKSWGPQLPDRHARSIRPEQDDRCATYVGQPAPAIQRPTHLVRVLVDEGTAQRVPTSR